jgi:hypothetical protein
MPLRTKVKSRLRLPLQRVVMLRSEAPRLKDGPCKTGERGPLPPFKGGPTK